MKKRFLIVLSAAIVLSLIAGCGASTQNDYSPAPQSAPATAEVAAVAYGYESDLGGMAAPANRDMVMEEVWNEDLDVAESAGPEPLPPDERGIAGPETEPVIDARKIIKNARLEIQTLSFDRGVEFITGAAVSFGGFVERSFVSGLDMYSERGTRTASFTLRIPAENIDAFIHSLGNNDFNIISRDQYSDDITAHYYDSRARLNSLRIQEERLLSMLENASELEYLLQVEKEIMNVRYEIESLTSALRRMDSSVQFSTVDIALVEVVKYDPVKDAPATFGERISHAFSTSIENFSDFVQGFVIFVVSIFPFLLLIGAITLIIVYFVMRSDKKIKKRMAQQQSPQPSEDAQGGEEKQ